MCHEEDDLLEPSVCIPPISLTPCSTKPRCAISGLFLEGRYGGLLRQNFGIGRQVVNYNNFEESLVQLKWNVGVCGWWEGAGRGGERERERERIRNTEILFNKAIAPFEGV